MEQLTQRSDSHDRAITQRFFELIIIITSDPKTGGFHYDYLIAAACCAISAASVGLTISCAGIFFDPISETLGVGKGDFAFYMSLIRYENG